MDLARMTYLNLGELRAYCARSGGAAGDRQHMQLALRRHYQVISGTARIDGREIVITDGRIRGERLSFTLWHAQHVRPPVKFTATVNGSGRSSSGGWSSGRWPRPRSGA